MPDHLVWPEGPPCDPSCPGEWSQYHDGYSWGYEKGTAALDAALARERRLREHEPRVGGFCDSGIYLECSCDEWDNFMPRKGDPETWWDHATLAVAEVAETPEAGS